MDQQPKRLKLEQPSSSLEFEEEITEKDLPILANVEDVRVLHYLMKFRVNFQRKVVSAESTMFLEWMKPDEGLSSNPKIILDACHLDIKNVYALKRMKDYRVPEKLNEFDASGCRKNFYKCTEEWQEPFKQPFCEKLEFTVDKWSVTISGWSELPSVIRIEYETLPTTPSLDWRPCNGQVYDFKDSTNLCCYSPVTPVNNRGLFPCQEPPSALATWEILLQVEHGFVPLLSSDEPGELVKTAGENETYYFFTSIPLPMSTFAIVIGNFVLQEVLKVDKGNNNVGTITDKALNTCDNHIRHPCRFGGSKESHQSLIPVRLFSLDKRCVSSLNLEKLSDYLRVSLQVCHENFGPHPFPRLDIVIMPFCFSHMGLANPSLIFLSVSNFSGGVDERDEPLFVCRIPHEICHSWFGLLIGALDWTEEWLSEGFSTFCEDVIILKTYQNYFPNMSKKEVVEEHALKICLRFITLQSELQNTNDEFHIMSRKPEDQDPKKTKNGLEPMKMYMHLHYYKGYLLLWYLASLVGQQNFLKFLKQYIWTFHCQLVTSAQFLQFYFEKFKDLLEANEKFVSVERLKSDWLESNKLPEPFNSLDLFESCDKNESPMNDLPLFSNAKESLAQIKRLFAQMKTENYPKEEELLRLGSTKIIILLEFLLREIEEDRKSGRAVYEHLIQTRLFRPEGQNPEIMHRWCELIILNHDKGRLKVVEDFLERHMGMGIYLYGELMISERFSFQKLAKRLFRKMEGLYDLGTRRLLREMIF